MNSDEFIKYLMDRYERIDKEDAERAADLKTTQRIFIAVFFVVFVVLAAGIGYTYGVSSGYSLAVDRAVELIGPGIRVMLR